MLYQSVKIMELDGDDVVNMSADHNPVRHPTFKVSQFLGIMLNILKSHSMSSWLNGIECEVLNAKTGGWKKGKIRIRVEFIPDEPPPNPDSLDEIRAQLNQLQQ